MIRLKLEIRLLSDMCCGSGEGDGIYQDMSSSYDEKGLPVIYGKRLKGLIRDKAEFLLKYNENRYQKKGEELVKTIFGMEEQAGILRVGNAELEYAKEIKADLDHLNEDLSEIINSKMIESIYTVQRYSTQIDEKGIAKDHSLRMIGAVPKGEIFVAELELNSDKKIDKNSDEYRLIEDSCKILRRIGLNRTRGFGEVQCILSDIKDDVSVETKNDGDPYRFLSQEDSTGSFFLQYTIETNDNVISRSDYIAGSSVQGMYINELLKYGSIIEDEVHHYIRDIRFSNAYLHVKWNKEEKELVSSRSLPMPKGMRTVKNDSSKIYSMAEGYEVEPNKQYVRVGGYYILENNTLIQIFPSESMEYHYAKSTHDLFTLKSLKSGQIFEGRIESNDREKLKKLVDLIIAKKGEVVLGASSNAQYAATKFNFIIPKTMKEDIPESDQFVVNFVSDTVLIDKWGVNLSDSSLLEDKVKELFEGEAQVEHIYTDTMTVGGYHSKWKLPKRRYTAFAKGTQVVVKNVKNLPEKKRGFMGLLQTEGYGEYEIQVAHCDEYELKKFEQNTFSEKKAETNFKAGKETEKIIVKVLIKRLEDEFMVLGETLAKEYCKQHSNLSASSAMRLLSAYRAVEKKEDFEKELYNYIQKNFVGDSNKEIRTFSDHPFELFTKLWKIGKEQKEEYRDMQKEKIDNMEKRIVFLIAQLNNLNLYDKDSDKECRINSDKNRLLRVFIQGYLEAAKLYYREKHNKSAKSSSLE